MIFDFVGNLIQKMKLVIKYPGLGQTLIYLKKQIKDSKPAAAEYLNDIATNIQTPSQLYRHLKQRVTFKKDPIDREYIQSLQTLITNNWFGDCDCFTVAACALLQIMGYRTAIILQGRGRTPSHILAAYFDYDNKEWVPFDLTNKEFGVMRYYPKKQLIPLNT